MSRPDTPLDNAVAESFFKTLKRELVEERSHGTRGEAEQGVFKYMELYYNRVRMHPPWATCLQWNTSGNTLEGP